MLGLYWGYIGIMEYRMETTKVYWGYVGIIENEVHTLPPHIRWPVAK